MAAVKEINQVYIVTNARFYDHFRLWLNDYHSKIKIKLLNDGTISNEDRLGAIGDVNFVLKEEDVNDDLMVIAGDNLFGFSLQDFAVFFNKQKSSVIAFHDFKDKAIVRQKYGVGILEGTKVINFEEKPLNPKSTLGATACYIYHRKDLPLVEKAVQHGYADNCGDMIRYLVKNSLVHGLVFAEHWFDIGDLQSLKAAEQLYSKKI